MPVHILQLLNKTNMDGTPLNIMWQWVSVSMTLATQKVAGLYILSTKATWNLLFALIQYCGPHQNM